MRFSAHVIDAGASHGLDAVAALVMCDGLGLITLACGLDEDEIARARAQLGDRLLVPAGEEGASVEGVIGALRARDVVR